MTHISTEHYVYAMSKDNTPVAHIEPSQRFTVDTFDCFRNQMEGAGYVLEGIDFAKVNPATGPVFIQGAEKGDVLAVTIHEIELADKGSMVSSELFGSLSHKLSGSVVHPVTINGNSAEIAPNLNVPLSPMVGVIGTAPAEGSIACGSPGEHGGNMDTKEIKQGSVVYLPVNHPGGLLSLGDLHAAMGDGELSGTGIEIPGKVTLSVEVLKQSKLPTPAVSIAVMSFLGFDGVSTLTEEAKDGVKTHYVPFISLCIAVVLFLAQVVFAAWVLPNPDAFQANSGNAWYVIAKIVGGGYLSTACALLTALSWGITNALASQTAVSRVIFGMANDGVLPRSLATLNKRFKTPHVAIALSGLVSAVLVFLFEDHLDVFVSFVNFGALTGFILLHLAVLSWCNIKNKCQNVFIERLSPLCGIAMLSYVWIALDQSAKMLGLAWLVVGVIVIAINKYRGVSINIEALD